MNQEIKSEIKPEIRPEIKEERKIMQEQYPFFGIATVIYALFYTVCLYKNTSGIATSFFVGGTLCYFCLCMAKFSVPFKKDAVLYIVSILLLGVSLFLTDDYRLISMSKIGIIMLLVSFMIHHFYNDKAWNFGKYLGSFVELLLDCITSFGNLVSDFLHWKNRKKEEKKLDGKGKYIVLGLIIAIPLVFIIFLLLVSADTIFANIFETIFNNIFQKIVLPKNLLGILITFLFALFTTYSFIAAMAKKTIKEEVFNRRTQEPLVAITITIILSILYLLFCSVQIAGLFFGKLLLPEGYSYANYAREGFFQLLFVCIINLGVVLFCLAYFRESKLLKILLTIISGCTYIMIISSAIRMILYIQVYYLTFLRIFVLWSLIVIFIVMTGVLISIYNEKFPLFRFAMFTVTALYILLAFSHPDYFIASYNLSKIEAKIDAVEEKEVLSKYGDISYLLSMSKDAAPAILDFYQNESQKVEKNDESWYNIERYFDEAERDYKSMDLRTFNISRFIAGQCAKVALK